ncbi:MAG: acetate--CoA ligase, partial [Deltaproteobacteria bacterium]|nr:acetate--CoA ligase [Deltaproteobacteria bacterium]
MRDTTALEALATEDRRFPPPDSFVSRANVSDSAIYARAEKDLEGFWAEQARTLEWRKPFTEVLDWKPPYARWFADGELNVSENCLDRHVRAGHGDRVAFRWEGEPGDTRTVSYRDLLALTSRAANALKELGVRKGDRVAIYMPMVPELPAAMLACARIGAPFTVVFGGFSSEALAGRIADSEAKLLITADGGYRKGSTVPLKRNADAAVAQSGTVEKVLVVRRTREEVPWTVGRDVWWHDVVDRQSPECAPESLPAEHMLYLLYTSGTTAKPKGIVHTTGGYLTGVATTHRLVFDIKPEDDVYWCAADIGWVTGHSYIVFGPLANGATSVMYEGTPDFPDRDRWWRIVEKYGVTILYCAPTAIRTFMKWGDELPKSRNLSTLRLLGSVGEPINPEAWRWYARVIGGDRCPVVDTWWMTETGMILITPLPGITTTKPGSATFPFPGVKADVVDESGASVAEGAGYLVLERPWPAMLRGVYKDDARFKETYWSRFPGRYFAGDGAKRDKDGYLWLLGRVDDVMKVSGHRISTTEVESALVSHPKVAEAAVIGREDPVTTQAIFAFVTLRGGNDGSDALAADLREHVVKAIGSIARPKQVMFTPELPKTRSGKIMRRLLRDIANGRPLGDTTTLADPTVVESIKSGTGSE